MSGIYDLTGQNIENTYQRVVQTSDGINYYDGTGSLLPLSSSFLSGASAVGSTITFTRGDGSTFPVIVAAGTGAPGGPNTSVQFNGNGVFSGSSFFTFNSASDALTLTGSLNITGSTLQVGNNTLLGNTTLSGSIIISGALGTNNPTVKIYGDTEHNGYIRFDPVTTNIDQSISASYIYVSGSTNDLYFTQNGGGYNNTTRLRWLEGNLYTGLLNGGLISQVNTTTYQISSGSGVIVNMNASYNDNPYPTIQYLNWGNLTANIAPLSASFDQQFIAISSSAGTAVIKAQGTPYDNGDFNTLIPIGIVIHQNRSTINAVQTFPGVAYGWKQRSFDFIKAFGPLKVAGYVLAQSGSSTRGLVLSGGTAWVDGRNYTIDPNNPSYIVEATGITTSKIFRYYQSGSNWQSTWGYNTNAGAGYTDIDPTQYSNAGTLTPVGSNKWSIQRVFYFPNSATKAFYIYYGNAEYANEAAALAAVTTETFTEAPNTAANAIYVGFMLLRNDADFTNGASYTFYQAGLFRGSGTGGAGGGGGGATTLAALTDVSLSSLTYGDLLMYNASTGLWNNTHTLSGSYFLSGSLTTNDGLSVQSITASFISASSITGSLFGTASYSITASYALNGGVTQLLAGPNISLSPTNGLGQVTITSTGGGGVYGNTATGSYGSFYDTTIQNLSTTNTPYSMSLNTTDISNGVSISGSVNPYNTYIKMANAGVYDIQFSAQIDKTTGTNSIVYIWLRKNGLDLAETNTSVTLAGGANDKAVAAWNWFVNAAAGDYFQLMWAGTNNNVRLFATGSNAIDAAPAVPSLIVTANRIDQFLSNTGSFTGSFTGQFIGTASWATNSTNTTNIAIQALTNNVDYNVPLIVGSSTPAPLGAASPTFTYNPSTATLKTPNISGSLIGTASYALYALSASWAPGGGSTSPGGSDTNIQFNSGSTFNGSNNLTYQYNTTATDAYKLTHTSDSDFSTNRFYADQYKASIVINNKSGVNERQIAGITNHQIRQAANTGKTTIFKFAAGGGSGGGITLNVLGFKCDYSLALYDGTYFTATRIGTLQGVWDFDNNYDPIIQDNSISGDITYNQLQLAQFSLIWNGSDIDLQLDTGTVDYDVVFNGLFNIFSQTLV